MTIGSNIIKHEILTSTNITAISLASSGKAEDGTVVRADYQTAGKGQPGNSWESQKGKNLLFSIILHPSGIMPDEQFFVSMAISTGIHDYLSGIISECTIKWPNDIFAANDKIAGILIESSITGSTIDYMVAGIGMNVNQELFSSGKNPTSLKILTGRTFSTDEVFNDLIQCLDRRYNLLKEGQLDMLKDQYLERLYRYKEMSEFIEKGKTFTGRIIGVGNDGAIIIEKSNGRKNRYYFKEIEFKLPSLPSI